MLQYSIYTRIVKNNDDADKYIHRLKYNIPPKNTLDFKVTTPTVLVS